MFYQDISTPKLPIKEPTRTLWMGNLHSSFDEITIQEMWNFLNRSVSVELIKVQDDRLPSFSNSGHVENYIHNTTAIMANVEQEKVAASVDSIKSEHKQANYCLVEFESQQEAAEALTLNGLPLPNFFSRSRNSVINASQLSVFRLNWAVWPTVNGLSPEYPLFVGNLSSITREADLLLLFRSRYKSVKTVRMMTEPIPGKSDSFGFICFANCEERRLAAEEMNGICFQDKYIKVAIANPRDNMIPSSTDVPPVKNIPPLIKTANDLLTNNLNAVQEQTAQLALSTVVTGNLRSNGNIRQGLGSNSKNSTIFVGGLSTDVSEQELNELFRPFGEIMDVKIPLGKKCGFVTFKRRIDAKAAIKGLHGFLVRGCPIRLSWGKTFNNTVDLTSGTTRSFNSGYDSPFKYTFPDYSNCSAAWTNYPIEVCPRSCTHHSIPSYTPISKKSMVSAKQQSVTTARNVKSSHYHDENPRNRGG
ncbi:Ngr1p NDAI_0F01720 [Naumovozyma dairenensis CBS 421]|uniref:RRM domain-containing protein n=1 Tax=Naumovozyma dairenensis (strain ATCC 10597 / BCRC 20456 / CBS 421 / NBRC 0211 / NRRL Y-12639) TaxID=1071378 RepID=G0WCI0_NAUDC|nr:hypothetical protein NDAI_0F01720 [Naumovozyma dairenensis CBS 421]CCD25491.1 hypothetical protein NDAI_0F01720 [Naumovozyma dairenensis CBS 421]